MRHDMHDITISEFVAGMNAGWGYRSPGRVQALGKALDVVLADMPPETLVHVDHFSMDGDHTWTIRGLDIVAIEATIETTARVIFGGLRPEIFTLGDRLIAKYIQ